MAVRSTRRRRRLRMGDAISVPHIDTQRQVVRELLNTKLKQGDIWYLVDVRWMKAWKKYTGYDEQDQSSARQTAFHPGPLYTSDLFVDIKNERLRDHLMEEVDYSLVPEAGWEKLVEWYGMAPGSRTIPRKVVECGLSMKHCKVEVYRLEFKLAMHPKLTEIIVQDFSRDDTVAALETAMRRVYAIPANILCRVWHRYALHTYELLSDPNQTLQDAGLYNMQTIVIEKQNTDGTWPRGKSSVKFKPAIIQNTKKKEEAMTSQEVEASTKIQPLHQDAGEDEWEVSEGEIQPQKPTAYTGGKQQVTTSEDKWLLEQQQSQHDELVQTIAAEQKRANQASQRAQSTLTRPAQREDELKSLKKDFDRSLKEEQQRRLETESRASQAEETVSQLHTQLQNSKEENDASIRRAEAAESRASMAEEVLKQQDRQIQELTVSLQELTGSLQAVEEERNGAIQRYEVAEDRIKTLDAQLQNTEQQQRDTEQQLQQAYQRADQQQERATTAEMRLQHSDQVFQDLFQRLIGQLPQSQPYWVVQRNEIELLEEEIGSGGWATVKVAKFRGNRVAAKCLHRQIVSAHNVRLFTREMNMAANARHPNLLQFIGATLDNEEPIILTELMSTSLRHILEGGTQLTHAQIISLSRQVALALNYLHLMQPEAVIHRDVSSANVLLEPHQGSWITKLSDYGSANFVRHTTTAGPGNPTYAAPEANNPDQQSAKMDVFSFGVLLVEMCSGELAPAEHRDRLLASIQWPNMVALIRHCLRHEPQRRPDMNTVITQLDQL